MIHRCSLGTRRSRLSSNLLVGQSLVETSELFLFETSSSCGVAFIYYTKPEITAVMHAVILGPTSARTGGEIRFSKFGENMTTPSKQLRMDLEAMES